MADDALALRVRDVSVRLRRTQILASVDVDVEAGAVVGVLGPSGAGKSTLFRVIAGELRPTMGSVHLGGVDVSDAPLWKRARAGLGYVPQEPSVLWDLSVRDNILAFERAVGADSDPMQRAREVGLGDRLDLRARQLSGGERRRLELLRALTTEPRVLVCDEPFAGIDPARADELCSLIRQRADRGTAVLVADHRVREALTVCSEVILLVEGRVQVRLPPTEFTRHPAVRERYLG